MVTIFNIQHSSQMDTNDKNYNNDKQKQREKIGKKLDGHMTGWSLHGPGLFASGVRRVADAGDVALHSRNVQDH